MFGYFFSNALISTVRVSVAPAPAIGLADHTMLPDVADPEADEVALLPPVVPELLLLLPPLLQPARATAPTAPTTAVSCQPRMGRLPGYLRDPIVPPLKVVDSLLYVIALVVTRVGAEPASERRLWVRGFR
jgi:hypothetical protein